MQLPKPSVPRQSQRPKPVIKQPSWRPRWPNTIQFNQLRQPIPEPSVMPRPRQLPRLQCFRRNTAITCRALRSRPSGKKVEVVMTSSPPFRPPYTTVHSQLGGAGCILPFAIDTNTSITLIHPAPKDPSHGRTDILSCSFHANTQTVSETKKVPSFARANGGPAPGQSYPGGYDGRTSLPQEIRNLSLV